MDYVETFLNILQCLNYFSFEQCFLLFVFVFCCLAVETVSYLQFDSDDHRGEVFIQLL